MELRAIRQQMQESPPPPPYGTTVREWFTGLALMNPELMKGLNSVERITEAIRLADELVVALAAPRTPSQESMRVPTTEDGLVQSWNGMANAMKASDRKERQERDTNPGIRRAERTTTVTGMGAVRHPTIPPPSCPTAAMHFRRASDHLLQRPATPLEAIKIPGMGSYSSLRPGNNDE